MGIYMDKLSRLIPVVKNKRVLTEQGVHAVLAEMEFLPEGDYYEDVPYLEKIEDLYCKLTGEGKRRVFLVAEEENIAVKAALAYRIYPVYADRENIYEQMKKQGMPKESRVALRDAEGNVIHVRIVSMTGERKSDGNANPFQGLVEGVTAEDITFYDGLEENAGLEDKLNIIMAGPELLQFVRLKSEQLGAPWLREFMMDRECEVVHIPNVSNSYYEQILARLLENEKYELEAALTPELLVRSLRRKCNSRFREEDLAWSLEQAVKKAEEESRSVLCFRDFLIGQEESETSLKRLQGMTGLNNVKQLAMEYAALGREQAVNEKVAEVCRHLIFVGAPGSGKTMCSGLLAKIMAEEGQSNGGFVIASRKDIIGEYIGHTAPKVAKLFNRARHGVLFVDEAGFFLHNTRNSSFNGEAVKEFVRYMELYQDVTVIFALYPDEIESWMQLDAGLSSRIGRILEFENYSDDELVEIGRSMCHDRGYSIAEDVESEICGYVCKCRQTLGEKFGNAREVRKLVEGAIIAKSVRCFEQNAKERDNILLKTDFANAVSRLLNERKERKRAFGFAATEAACGSV